MQINTWSGFSKRINSTKRPQPASATIHTVLLKDGADIKSPVFELNILDFTINYVEAFGNYYFAHVQNIDGHRCNIICTMDYMATFKSQIGAYTGYIDYASSAPAGNITWIDDPRNMPSTLVKTKGANADPGWTSSSAGCYLIGMANAVSIGNCGAPAYYCTNATGLASIVASMFDPNLVPTIRNQFNGVFDAIVSCIWLPFDGTWLTGAVGAAAMPVYAGYQDLGVGNMAMLTGRIWKKRVSATLPTPGDYAGTYIQSNKYNTCTAYLPGVGVCPLNYDIYKENQLGVSIDIHFDAITGDIVYYLSTAAPGSVSETQCFSGNIAAKVPVVGASYDGIGVASGILSTASNAASGDLMGTEQGLIGLSRSLSVDNIVIGGNSSPLAFSQDSNIRLETHQIVPVHGQSSMAELEVFRAEQGMPYFDNATISSLSGYVQCRAASISIPGDGEEQNIINGYLNSGFYYE